MPNDRELIDALCRLRNGWTKEIPGDEDDFIAATKIVSDRCEQVRGTFAPLDTSPTLLDAAEAALEFIGEYDAPRHPRAILSLKLQAAIAAAKGEPK